MRILTLCLLATGLTACADFVPLKPEAERIQVSKPELVGGCTLKGSTRVKVLAKLGPLSRDEGKQIIELNTLARNSALDLQGDTVVPAGPIENGERDFKVYRCR
ncbi:DUF4156 domain-containing protein [Chitinimonas sp. BJYL2]|uniref:DUF4156 domain-containing protein n=1 Tax=Chitinimonas sp. BJYL2 TaxID=2976696 RepID=UPI0022B3E014|nr:DUF4156 domain-containing protein [Chitinimonas sp. BJYL2]